MSKHYKIARGEAMECAASLDVLKVRRLIEHARYERGIELLEAVVAMLTKMISRFDDVNDKGGAHVHGAVNDHDPVNVTSTSRGFGPAVDGCGATKTHCPHLQVPFVHPSGSVSAPAIPGILGMSR